MTPFKVEGIVPATFTPFGEDGEVNLEAIDTYQQFLFDRGIRHIYINGSTGEGTSLTTDERKQLCEAWVKSCRIPGREMKVLVQVGGCSFKDVEELTKHARKSGVDAISTLPSLYFTPSSLDDLVDYCKRVGEMAPDIPLYYYNIPERTGVKFDMETFLIRARGEVPSLRGVKFSSSNIFEGSRCLRVLDGNGHPYDILYGSDEQLLSALAMGFQGAIGSTYNFMPNVYQAVMSALKSGRLEEARREQFKSVDTVQLLFQYGNRTGGLLPAAKAVMASLNVPVGSARFPMSPLARETREELLDRLKQLGFFEWVKA